MSESPMASAEIPTPESEPVWGPTSPYRHPGCGGVVAYEERVGARDVWRCQRCGATVSTEVPDA